MFKAIEIDRDNLTIMGVKFSDIKTLESTANAIGSNMFEGFEPTTELIQLYVDWKSGKLKDTELLTRLHHIHGK
jgi:putative transcriptional regulator